jgi:endonuclease YncB( thermonuclease family)
LLNPLFDAGVVATNGYRTPADIQRLKAQGYHPAENSLHLDGDAVDLVPGKSGLSLAALKARADAIAARWPGGRTLNEGDHIHLQLPGWHMAPGTPGTPNAGIPPLPPGATLQQRGSLLTSQGGMFAPRAALNSSTALTPVTLTGQAHDGDTVQLANGRNGRLSGVDAFELNQTGRNSSNQVVPLGQQARNFMLGQIGPGLRGFPTGSSTYGRPVINLSQNPYQDPAYGLLTRGLAMAEPQYLTSGTPRFDAYMQGDRLGRLNQQGGYQTDALTPPAFRHGDNSPFNALNYAKAGDENATALFKDEPTPFQGYRPEVEKALVSIWQNPKGTPEQYIDAGKQFGLSFDPDAVAKKFASRFDSKGNLKSGPLGSKLPNPVEQPRPLINPGDGSFGSFARGLGDPFNALDELGGVTDSLGIGGDGPRISIWNAPKGTRFGDILSTNIDQNRAILDNDALNHPYARLTGQLATGVALPMGVADTPLSLAAIMAAQGGAAGFMGGEGSIRSRLPDAALGAVEGAVAGPVLYGAGKYVVGPIARKAGNVLFRRATDGAASELPPLPQGFTVEPTTTATEHGDTGPFAATQTGAAYIHPDMLQRVNGGHSAAMAMDRGPELVAPRGLPPLPEGFKLGVSAQAAQRAKRVSDIQPETVIQPLDNSVSDLAEAERANPSRFQDLQAPDETQQLGVRTVTTPNGGKVRVRGPLDLTQSVRLMGGITDEGGDAAHLGLSNAARRMDFGSNEQFLGKLINPESGLHPDDAAQALWEEGYFPHLREMPSGDDLLQMLRDEQFGQRYFHPEDLNELADYHSALNQRHTVEQAQQEGVPLAEDNSEPVSLDDMLKRTAPDYAYADAPGRRIGNLDVTKIESGSDLAALMQHIEGALGDHPAQATETHAQTKEAARELGMSVQDFLNTQPGQLDAKRIIAGRVLLHSALEATRRAALKVVNGGTAEDKLAFERAKFVTALIQDQMKAATAEAGRTLQALRIVSTKDDARLAAIRQVIKSRGGHDAIEDSAQDFLNVSEDPAKANRYIQENTKASWLQMFNEGLTMARLSNPVTHARNFLGNALSTAVSFPETAVESGLGKLLGSPDRSYISEVGARARGISSALPDAVRNMWKVARTGEPIDGVTKIEANMNYRAIPGRIGEIIRVPGNAMTAADEAWKTLIVSDHINALARRNAINSGLSGDARAALESQLRRNPTDAMIESAKVEARYRTFQQELGKWGKQLQTIANTWPGAKILLTFVRTPINLVKFAGERSVFAATMPSVLRKLAQGGRARDEALSRIIVGTSISTAAVMAAMHDRVSGNGPDDYRQKAALMQTGWRPNSIRVGDKWVSYQGLDPVSTLVAVAADFAQAGKWATPQERQNIATNLALSAAESASNRTWMGGVADFFAALHDPKHSAAPFLKSQVAGLVPSGLGQATAYSDPYLRNAQTILQGVKARVPFLSNSVPVQRNVWGDPIRRDQAIGPDIVSPFRYGQVSSDPLANEVARLGIPLQKPSKVITDDDGNKVTLSPEQYDQFVQLAGQPAKAALAKEMASPEWRQMSDDDKREAVKSIISDMRDAARDELRSTSAPAAAPSALPPLPPGYQLAR